VKTKKKLPKPVMAWAVWDSTNSEFDTDYIDESQSATIRGDRFQIIRVRIVPVRPKSRRRK